MASKVWQRRRRARTSKKYLVALKTPYDPPTVGRVDGVLRGRFGAAQRAVGGESVTVDAANAVRLGKSTYNPGLPAQAQFPVVTAPRRMRGAERPMKRGPDTSLLDACVELDALVVGVRRCSPTKKG